MPIKDPILRAEYHKKYMKEVWYPANKSKHQKMVHRRRQAISEYVVEIKNELGCSRCSETEPCCLDFHHIYDNKLIDISKLSRMGWSWKRIDEEIAKCIILCSNCHRKEHHKISVAV